MKVKLLARKGSNPAGTVLDLSKASAEMLVQHGYAEKVGESETKKTEEPKKASGHTETVIDFGTDEVTEETPKPAPRRGRRKAE